MPWVNLRLDCERCGERFSAIRPSQRFCSKTCSVRARVQPPVPCSARPCDRTAKARGYCDKHYRRWKRTGRVDDLDAIGWVGTRVIENDAGCWIWQGHPTGGGYGQVNLSTHNEQAHRYIYRILVGPIPDGLDLDHLCMVRLCCNPHHLEPVTHAENMRRAKNPACRPPVPAKGHQRVWGRTP